MFVLTDVISGHVSSPYPFEECGHGSAGYRWRDKTGRYTPTRVVHCGSERTRSI
jgi:hypothetical protein